MNLNNPKAPNIKGHKGLKRQNGGSPYLPTEKQNPQHFRNTGGPHGPSKGK